MVSMISMTNQIFHAVAFILQHIMFMPEELKTSSTQILKWFKVATMLTQKLQGRKNAASFL